MVGNNFLKKNTLLLIVLFWFILNLFFLQAYPFVHTDEPWLSGLTRSMIDAGSPAATEDFFDLYPRHPHAIKILYHLLQIPFILIFGYSLFSVRLLSLCAGALTLLLFARLLRNVFSGEKHPLRLLIILLMACDIQFIYISHLARQESCLLLVETAVLLVLTEKDLSPGKRGLFAGILTGAAAGVHPNAFIIAWPPALFLLISVLSRRRPVREGLMYLTGTAGLTLIFISLSFSFNPSFIQDYLTYGQPLGVLQPVDVKWLKLPGFYARIFTRTGGTYHTPPVMLQMMLFPLVLLIDFFRNRKFLPLAGFLGFSIASAIIGKYSQPSIIFLLPFYYLALSGTLTPRVNPPVLSFSVIGLSALLVANLIFTVSDLTREKETFSSFLRNIEEVVPADSILVSNLYGEYVTGTSGRFYDWRNLVEIKDGKDLLEEYLADRSVEYVILSDELDFVYARRPVWNVLYGNITHWYPEMQELLKEKGRLVKEFSSPGYAMRIAPYRYRDTWKVRIYQLDISPEDP